MRSEQEQAVQRGETPEELDGSVLKGTTEAGTAVAADKQDSC